jgi:hypothetical protein
MWLWNVKPYISFDEGSRVEGFAPFESIEQFKPIAEHLVERAMESVIHYRKLFPTVWSVSDFYLQKCPPAGWPSFNAAVAHGLSGRIEAANICSIAGVTKQLTTVNGSRMLDWMRRN